MRRAFKCAGHAVSGGLSSVLIDHARRLQEKLAVMEMHMSMNRSSCDAQHDSAKVLATIAPAAAKPALHGPAANGMMEASTTGDQRPPPASLQQTAPVQQSDQCDLREATPVRISSPGTLVHLDCDSC
jgi:hypothetical protein